MPKPITLTLEIDLFRDTPYYLTVRDADGLPCCTDRELRDRLAHSEAIKTLVAHYLEVKADACHA